MDLSTVLPELQARFKVDRFRDQLRKSVHPLTPDPFWVETFQQLFVHSHQEGRDDLLFFIKWDPFLESEIVEVVRKDHKSLPSSSDGSILWEQTLYLNIILHEFDYEVTGSTVTVRAGTDIIDSVKAKIVLQVFPSPSNRRMDKKGQMSDVIYPNIMFCVDNFEEIFHDIHVCAPGEKVAIQLTASNKAASVKKMVFLGAVDYKIIKEAFEKKDHVRLGERLKRMSVKRSSRIYDFNHTYQFIQMRGPNLKGFAEMAISKAETHEANDQSVTPVHLVSRNPKHSPQLKHPGSGTNSTGAPLSVSRTSSKRATPGPVTTNGKDEVDGGNDILAGIPQVDTEQITADVKPNSLLRTRSNDQTTRGGGSSSSSTHLEDSPGCVSHHQKAKGRGSPGLVRASGGTSAWGKGSEEGSGSTRGATASQDLPGGEVSRKKGTLKGRLKFPRLSSKKKLTTEDPTLHAYLTYVQLPWYTLIDDILNNSKKTVV